MGLSSVIGSYAKIEYKIRIVANGIPVNSSGTTTSTYFPALVWAKKGTVAKIPTAKEIAENEKATETNGDPLIPSATGGTVNKNINYIKNLQTGQNVAIDEIIDQVTYEIQYYFDSNNSTSTLQQKVYLTYTFSVTNRYYPLKKWTITDAINRIFDTYKPLKYGEKPRFRLQGVIYDEETGNATGCEPGSIAEKLDKIIAPEFAFTKMTLREMLQQVGGVIHGEPRVLDIKYDDDGKEWFEVAFDMYGASKVSNVSKRHRVSASFRTNINDYCTSLDSSADNLISQLDWAQGVVTEPFNYYGAGRSLRTETTTTRMAEDDSTFIKTDLPIYTLGERKQVFCTNIPGLGATSGTITEITNERVYLSYANTLFLTTVKLSSEKWEIPHQDEEGRWYLIKTSTFTGAVGDSVSAYQKYDITPYIFEQADYNNLSSYQGTYPYAKCYALYYTQGQPNIKGLFFKAPHAITTAFTNYAIKNILETVTNKTLSLSGQDYMKLAFEVSYLPVYSTRVKTSKQTIIGGLQRTLAYNQSANLIESRHYGENLKGVVARLGNVEKTYTYHLAFLSDIPKAGMMFDKHYYISAVSVEYLPAYIKCTVALSKDFNRLSQYIGINSNKRMWEVSEKQSFERESLITEYVKITQNSDDGHDNKALYFNKDNISNVLFNKSKSNVASVISLYRYTKNEASLSPNVSLPLISTAIGNSMLFTCRFEDNYSAGQKSVYVDSTLMEKGGQGYWGTYVPYNDYYGRFYYLGLIISKRPEPTDFDYFSSADKDAMKELSLKIPQAEMIGDYVISGGRSVERCIKYRKDSREVPSITYELTAVTDDESIIIGSALMKNCANVNSHPVKKYQLYAFKGYLNNLDSYLDTTYIRNENGDIEQINIENGVLIADGFENGFEVNGDTLTIPDIDPTIYKSWAIVTEASIETIEVEDEEGWRTTQAIQKGGELVLGQNKIPENKTFYFRIKTNVYDI